MTNRRRELLEQLIEDTGLPPDEDATPDEVLDAAREMVESRWVLVEALAALGPVQDRSEVETEWTVLREHEDRWAARILAARNDLAQRLESLRRLPQHRAPIRKSIGTRRRA